MEKEKREISQEKYASDCTLERNDGEDSFL